MNFKESIFKEKSNNSSQVNLSLFQGSDYEESDDEEYYKKL